MKNRRSNRVVIFPSSKMVGKDKSSNSFTGTMSNCLRDFGWETDDFSYLKSLFNPGILIINWPEYFGRLGKGRTSSFTSGPIVIFLLLCKRIFKFHVVVVHHNLPGQRFPETWSQRILTELASKHVSLGASRRLVQAIGKEPIKLAHPAYPIIVKKQRKIFDFMSVVDAARSRELSISTGIGLFWSREGRIKPAMLGRNYSIVTGRLCERELQLLMSQSKTLLLPWPVILNSGLAILGNQLDSLVVSVDAEFVDESITNGIAAFSPHRQVSEHTRGDLIRQSKYYGIRNEYQFNSEAFGAPLDAVLRTLTDD